MSTLLQNWSGIVAIISLIVTIGLSLRKAPHETRKLGAETDLIHEEAADLATSRANKLEERLAAFASRADELNDRVGSLEDENEGLKYELENLRASLIAMQSENTQLNEQLKAVMAENETLRVENREFREWAEQLVKQVKSLNAIPVEPKSKPKRRKK